MLVPILLVEVLTSTVILRGLLKITSRVKSADPESRSKLHYNSFSRDFTGLEKPKVKNSV